MTVTTVGSRLSWNTARNSRTSNASISVADGADIAVPQKVLIRRLASHTETEDEGRSRPVSGLPSDVVLDAELMRVNTVDFAARTP